MRGGEWIVFFLVEAKLLLIELNFEYFCLKGVDVFCQVGYEVPEFGVLFYEHYFGALCLA